MRKIFATFCSLVCAANVSAQALPTGRASSADVSFGYSYIDQSVGQSSGAYLNGLDAGITVRVRSRFGVNADLGYARSSNLFGAPARSSILSYLAGPVLYLTPPQRLSAHVRGLVGGAKVVGPVPVPGGILIGGWATGFAWAVGGGVDYQLSHSIGVRSGVDFMRTPYFGSSSSPQAQNNIRITVSIVYSLRPGWHKRR